MNIVRPHRVTRSYVQSLISPPDEVFPLLCPVREAEWVNGWHPRLVISTSGVAEPDCVFITAAGPQEAIWAITRHEPDRHHLEIVKVIPGIVVGKIVVRLAAASEGSTAEISYSDIGRDIQALRVRMPDGTSHESSRTICLSWIRRRSVCTMHNRFSKG